MTRFLLALYPKAFRRQAGPDLEAACAECVRRERARFGSAGVLYAWIRLLVDSLVSSAAIRADLRRRRRIAALHQPTRPQGDTHMGSLVQDIVLVESSLLALCGGAFGVLLAWWGSGVLVSLAPPTIPRTGEIGMDGRGSHSRSPYRSRPRSSVAAFPPGNHRGADRATR